ncbi:MAG: D-aminoacyl-tRNA deacylase [Thermodesulfobacteriota bacterium]|nr:D-aminoacyl-tRNA deacylase [Thermodesulfobacteriota bacterium]
MRAVIQRVRQASIRTGAVERASIKKGLCCLIGVEKNDADQDIEYTRKKILGLRIFDDTNGRMNLNVAQVSGKILLVPQFTLCGDARKARRPSYSNAMCPDKAGIIFDRLVSRIKEGFEGQVKTGVFQAEMDLSLINHGPVTILLDSRKQF